MDSHPQTTNHPPASLVSNDDSKGYPRNNYNVCSETKLSPSTTRISHNEITSEHYPNCKDCQLIQQQFHNMKHKALTSTKDSDDFNSASDEARGIYEQQIRGISDKWSDAKMATINNRDLRCKTCNNRKRAKRNDEDSDPSKWRHSKFIRLFTGEQTILNNDNEEYDDGTQTTKIEEKEKDDNDNG